MFSSEHKLSIIEPSKQLPIVGSVDVIVAGGGPAGCAAAIAASRCGASVILLESSAMVGGIMTSGLMSNIIDAEGKSGFLMELLGNLKEMDAAGSYNSFEPETIKYYLEKVLIDANVRVRYNTLVVNTICDDRAIKAIVTESPAGREAFTAKIYIDCTGNGTLAANAGCSFQSGDPKNDRPQAASLCAFLYGVDAEKISCFCEQKNDSGKFNLLEKLESFGLKPSYRMPTLFQLTRSGYLLMSNHEHGVCVDDADAISAALIHARSEIYEQVMVLKKFPPMANLCLAITASALGIREGRRINALYNLSVDDLKEGRSQTDAVCKVRMPVDIHHSTSVKQSGYDDGGIISLPYDVPLRSLIAADKENLMLGGRCIGGDFYAHATYRVLGNAIPTGEAAGIAAATAVKNNIMPAYLDYRDFLKSGGNPHNK